MRQIILLMGLLMLTACAGGRDLDKPPVPLGDFKLGHAIVVSPNLTKGPLSRDATSEEWNAAVDKALEDRFRRYDGERIYHIGVSVEGYVLAQVGVPLVLKPKSILIFRLNVWDDATQRRLTTEPEEITVIEAFSPETLVGSGLTQSKEKQIENLSILAAKQIERWLVKQKREKQWFRGFVPPEPGTEPIDDAKTPGKRVKSPAKSVSTAKATLQDAPAAVVEKPEAVSDPEVSPVFP